MAHITADRVKDTSTTTGTGAFTVSGTAPTGYRTFSAVCSTSDTFFYCIAHQSATEWETGLGTYSSANTVTRTTVLASSNSNTAVNFSAGTKDVFISIIAPRFAFVDANDNLCFNSGYGSYGVAYACRAWVNFNGTGTVAIRASANVTSITDNGTGDYTMNFTTAMPDANYAAAGTAQRNVVYAAGNYGNDVVIRNGTSVTQTSSTFRFDTKTGAGTNEDPLVVVVGIFR